MYSKVLRALSLLLALIMLSAVVISCDNTSADDNTDNEATDTPSDTGTEKTDPTDEATDDTDVELIPLPELDLEGEEMEELRQRMMEFQYTRMMPFMNAKRSNEMVQTDCPDTLPALPVVVPDITTPTRNNVTVSVIFTANAVVLHRLVTKIIDAYDKYQKK